MKIPASSCLKTWSQEIEGIIRHPGQIFRNKLLRQTGILLSGDAGARVLSLFALTLTVRSIGAELFGVIVVAETYTKLIDRVFNFQCWTGIIRFGAQAIHSGNKPVLSSYIKLGALLDVLSSFAGFLFAFFMAPFVVRFLKWDPLMVDAVQTYSFLIMFNFTGTAIGILRLSERFSLLAWQRLFYALIKLLAVIWGWFSGGGLYFFLLSWMISEILGYAFVIGSAVFVAKRRGWLHHGDESSGPDKFSVMPFISFVLWTNLSSTVDVPTKFLDMVIVSSLVSFEAAGIYKIFQQIGHVLKKPMEPFYQVVYPYFSNDVAKGLPRLAIRSALQNMLFTVIPVSVILIISIGSAPWWLPLMFGNEISRFLTDFAIYMIITGLSVVLTNINPLFMALGFVRENFSIQAFSNLLFLIVAWGGGLQWGLRGVIMAFGVNTAVSSFMKVMVIVRKHRLRSGA